MDAEILLRVTERYHRLKEKIKNILVIETKWKTKVVLCPTDKYEAKQGEAVFDLLELAWLNEIKGENELLQAVENVKRVFGNAKVIGIIKNTGGIK